MKVTLVIAFFVVYVTTSGYATENPDDSEYDVQSAYPPQSVMKTLLTKLIYIFVIIEI